MKVKILERDKNLLRLEIEEEGHTLSNYIQTLLLQDSEVEIAGYDKHHPLMEKVILYLRTTGDTLPEEVLVRAAERGRKAAEEFRSIFEREMAAQESAQK